MTPDSMGGPADDHKAGRLQLGEPIELPWWAPAVMLPAALTLLGALVPIGHAGILLRGVDSAASVGLITATGWVSQHVESRNLQAVWLSAALAGWFFVAVLWLTGDIG